jgi:hypothetical protein
MISLPCRKSLPMTLPMHCHSRQGQPNLLPCRRLYRRQGGGWFQGGACIGNMSSFRQGRARRGGSAGLSSPCVYRDCATVTYMGQSKDPLHTFNAPDDLWRAARVRAVLEGLTMSDVLRRALQEYVEREVSPEDLALAEACLQFATKTLKR